MKTKIKQAYLNHIPTTDHTNESIIKLLELVVLIENDMLLNHSPSRLDYIKNGVQYNKRVLDKKQALLKMININNINNANKADAESVESTESKMKPISKKRSFDIIVGSNSNIGSNSGSGSDTNNSDIDEQENKKMKAINITANNTTNINTITTTTVPLTRSTSN